MPHMSTAERIGHRTGRQEGLVEGRQEGLVEGERIGQERGELREAAASIVEILEMRFGVVPGETAARLERIDNLQRLRGLRRQALSVASLQEFVVELSRLDAD